MWKKLGLSFLIILTISYSIISVAISKKRNINKIEIDDNIYEVDFGDDFYMMDLEKHPETKRKKIEQGDFSIVDSDICTVGFEYFYQNVSGYKCLIEIGEVVEKNEIIAFDGINELHSLNKGRLIEVNNEILTFENIDGLAVDYSITFSHKYSLENIVFYYYHDYKKYELNQVDKEFNIYTGQYIFQLNGFIVDEYFLNGMEIYIYMKYEYKNDYFCIENEFIFYDETVDKLYLKEYSRANKNDQIYFLYRKKYIEIIEMVDGKVIFDFDGDALFVTDYQQ